MSYDPSSQQRYAPVAGYGQPGRDQPGTYEEKAGLTGAGGESYPMTNVYGGSGSSTPRDPFHDPSQQSLLSTPTRQYSNSNMSGAAGVGAAAGMGAGAGAMAYGAGGDHGFSSAGPQPTYNAAAMAHDNVPSDQLWAMDNGDHGYRGYDESGHVAEKASSGKKKWIIIGSVLLLAAIVVGVVVGVVVSKNNSSSSSNSGSSKSGDSKSGSKDSASPDFEKDPKLHQVFWGMAYAPADGRPPWCANTQEAVNKDIQILSQLTTRLRLYGANCGVTQQVLKAIKDLKVDMKIYPAIYLDSSETNQQYYDWQVGNISEAITEYGADNIEGIAVGNEYLLIMMTEAGESQPSGPTYSKYVKQLASYVQDFKKTLKGWNVGKDIPVGTGDAGSMMSVELGNEVDYFMANVHPWFGLNTPVEMAAGWTWDYFQNNDVAFAEKSSPVPETFIAETGWPTKSMDKEHETNMEKGMAASATKGNYASEENLQKFLDTYVCQANKNGTKYFYFEPFDEPWKEQYGGVEPYWGLFDHDRNLKNIEIPTCE